VRLRRRQDADRRSAAQSGLRGEFEARSPAGNWRLSYAPTDPAPWLNRVTNSVSLAIPLLEPTDELRGVLVAPGGSDFRLRWIRSPAKNVRWSRLAIELQAASDSFQAGERADRFPRYPHPATSRRVCGQTQYRPP
jgi:hypothetical protein